MPPKQKSGRFYSECVAGNGWVYDRCYHASLNGLVQRLRYRGRSSGVHVYWKNDAGTWVLVHETHDWMPAICADQEAAEKAFEQYIRALKTDLGKL